MISQKNISKHNLTWSLIPDHPYRILIIRCSGTRKTNVLPNLIKLKQSINILLKNVKKMVLTDNQENSKAFTEYSNNIQDVYKIVKITTQAESVMY